MRWYLSLILLALLGINACTPAASGLSPTPTMGSAQAAIHTPSPTLTASIGIQATSGVKKTQEIETAGTQTAVFEETRKANRTQFAVQSATAKAGGLAAADTPSPTPSQIINPAATRSPAAPAVCPQQGGDAPGVVITDGGNFINSLENQILEYLNATGSSTGLAPLLNLATIPGEEAQAQAEVTNSDVTGDTVPEVIIDFNMQFPAYGFSEGAVYVYKCQEGQYHGGTIMRHGGEYLSIDDPDGLRAIRDMSGDGIPELVISQLGIIGSHAYFDRLFSVLSWDGSEFIPLIADQATYGASAQVFNGDGQVMDANNDGVWELALSNGLASYYGDLGPQRPRLDIWAWDGAMISLTRWEYPSPEYRIQAVYDGDDASRWGEYGRALAFYQDAIFNDSLYGWSYGQLWPDEQYGGSPTPTPDPEERLRLSAYARYRILLLHAVQGHNAEAEIVYNTLKDKFPPTLPGYPYVELAAEFWDMHSANGNIDDACAVAREFATNNVNDILDPLGSKFYGLDQRNYTVEDICPFD